MADRLTPIQRHQVMSHIRSTNTKPELILRHALWHRGFRYRINMSCLPGKPDMVLPKYKTILFIHGCFWHGHKYCKYYTIPKTNTDFWVAKVSRNRERDQEVWRKLEADGWSVVIVWECQLKKANIDDTVARVSAEIVHNGESYRAAQEERRKAREEYRWERRVRKEREQYLLKEVKAL